VDAEDLDGAEQAVWAADLEGAMRVAPGLRVNNHGAWTVGRGVAGAVSKELMNIAGADTVAVVPLVLGVHR
jgi:hypothetical protein